MRPRATLFATLAVTTLTGCKDSGLPDRNLPFDQAQHRPPDALVQAVYPAHSAGENGSGAAHGAMQDAAAHAGVGMASRPVRIGDQTFVPAGSPSAMDATSLRQVGGMGSVTFSAARWDQPPYDRLYMTHPGGQYVAYAPVHDDSGDPNARASAMEHGLEGGETAH